ncbi:hypothetical protein [Duganella sp.]|uniref:hypothetical protein n=1 Tax=Duganella sp. TaxID=1904440 RepID=UPI0031CDB81C
MAAAMACQEGVRQASVSSHQQADHSAQTESHCSTGEEQPAASAHGKCSQCASCCVGAAAPPAMDALLTPPPHATIAFAWLEPAMTAHVPAGLERPPRQTC